MVRWTEWLVLYGCHAWVCTCMASSRAGEVEVEVELVEQALQLV